MLEKHGILNLRLLRVACHRRNDVGIVDLIWYEDNVVHGVYHMAIATNVGGR